MKSIKLLSLALLLSLAGCETLKENYNWAKDNEDKVKEIIELVKEIPFSTSVSSVETYPKSHASRGSVTVDIPPAVEVYAVIDSDLLYKSIYEAFPGVGIDKLADSKFAILTLESIEEFIPWTQKFARQIGFVYGSEVLDCDNFARGFRGAVKYALAKSTSIEAEALCATAWVFNRVSWAGVQDGNHALNIMPYYSKKTQSFGILVIEPQNGIYTDLPLYPNKDYIYQITVSGG